MASDKKATVTRNDVAKLAGVSPAVVSYVMNNSKFVSEGKRAAVLAAIEELNYRPNILARGLKTNRTMQIAFICDNLRNDWLEGAEKLLFEKGYYVSHCYSRNDETFIQMVLSRRFDGVFMMSNFFSTEQLNKIAESGIPVALFKTRNYGQLDPKIVTVVPDYADGVKKSVQYLAMKGHKRIALIPPIRYQTKGLHGDDFRVRAYVEAMQQNGLELFEEHVCVATDTMESIQQSVFQMLAGGSAETRPTAMITGNDYLAVGIMQYIKKLNLRVPEDVAVMGVDNTYLAPMVSPTLTSVDFSKEIFAFKVADTLARLIDGEIPEDTFIPVSVVMRDSA